MVMLNIPFITWSVIVVAMIVLILVKICHNYCSHHTRHFFEIGNESEELFAPGDKLRNKEDFYGYYDD